MSLTSAQRRALAASGHALTPALTLGETDVSDSAIEHVRRQFGAHELIKVRVNTRDRHVFATVIEQVAAKAPCEIVQRVGRVALLYRPAPPSGENG